MTAPKLELVYRADEPPAPGQPWKRERKILWASMIGGLLFGGVAFAYKIAEFLFTLTSGDAQGFAEVPVTVYFAVAGGWLSLLAWCFITGRFSNQDKTKYDMLAQEERYERDGQ